MTNLFLLRVSANDDGFDRGYPIAHWTNQSRLYKAWESHFDGTWLQEPISDTNDNPKYPLRYDPCILPIMMHVSFLYGEVPDGASSLVQPHVEIWRDGKKMLDETSLNQADHMTSYLRTVWDQNSARSKQMDMALDSQVYGGAVVGCFFNPSMKLDGKYPIEIVRFEPPEFFPVWGARDYDNLIGVEIAYGISRIQAEEYGVELESNVGLYREMWNRREYEITIDDEVIEIYGRKARGRPPGGIIPFVYIPHPPRVGYYGRSLLHNMMAMAKEVNSRLVDTGDIVSEIAANIAAIRDAKDPRIRKLSGVKAVIDLGSSQGDRVPSIMYPNTNAGKSVSDADQYVRNLLDTLREEMYCSPVIFGRDEGSQRSAATLALRAIPLVSHIRSERALYTEGMSRLNKKILTISAEKGVGDITEEMAVNARVRSNWAPMMPRDVAQEITLLLDRVNAKVLSPETAIEKMGDILDIPGEIDKIRSWTDSVEPLAQAGRTGELSAIKRRSEDV